MVFLQSEAHKLLQSFWNTITDNISIEFSTAAKGKERERVKELELITCGLSLIFNFSCTYSFSILESSF